MSLYIGSTKIPHVKVALTAAGVSLQQKTVTPNRNTQNIVADSNYTGLSQVTVNPIPTNYIVPTGTLNITTNNTTVDVSNYSSASINIAVGTTVNNQEKSVNPSTSEIEVTPDNGYTGLSKVTVAAMPNGTASTPATTITANPTISISTSGKITASVSSSKSVSPSVTTGYITTGTAGTISISGSATQQLTVQAATTFTPTTTNQTIASGTYLTGIQTIKGDSNLVAGNIKNGISIFGVSGTYSGEASGGGITPTGSLDITTNGNNIDVTNYATVNVNVPTSAISIVDTLDAHGGTIRTITGTEIYGNTYTIDDVATNNGIANDIIINSSTIRRSCFMDCTNITSVIANNVTNLGSGKAVSIFENCTNLISLHMEKLTTIGNSNYFCRGCSKLTSIYLPVITDLGNGAFNNCTSLTVVVLPSATGSYNTFAGCSNLQIVDYGGIGNTGINATNFANCTKLTTLILRNTNITPLNNINVFNNSPFASGKSGGIIYIPESLYNHLGDGASLDYKAATNWSTIDGYGTITWAKIEGSQYENYYADGTPI